MSNTPYLGWVSIVRLGLVQSALGAIVMLTTSLLNRVMVVEYALAAAIPAGLVAWHYVIQLSRPKWGHGSDIGKRRTPFIIGGMGSLALGAILATNATLMAAAVPGLALVLAIIAYTMIGAGVGASGTSLLALLATAVAPERRAPAAATTWIMMIAGIVVTAGIAGQLLDPFSPQRLAFVAGGIAVVAFVVAVAAVSGVEQRAPVAQRSAERVATPFREALADVWQDPQARRFSVFVLVAMLAYSMQDMILEPFAGLVFEMTPGQSTSLSGIQHSGVLLGMILVGISGRAFGRSEAMMRAWVVGGCIGSAVALAGLAMAAQAGPGFPLVPAVFFLGFANGVFAVSAIGAMMGLAGADGGGKEGIRVGLWGAAQAMAFGAGGFLGAVGVDIGRAMLASDAQAFFVVFLAEASLFLIAAVIALTITNGSGARNASSLSRRTEAMT